MGGKKDLTAKEKTLFIKNLGDGKSTLEILKLTGRCHHTIKKVCGRI